MTDQEINLKIHKIIGFEWNEDRKLWEIWKEGKRIVSHKPWPFTHDLNCIHEAEGTLSDDLQSAYTYELLKVMNAKHWGAFELITATGKQRAEAFLRTFDKWEEAQ